MARASLATSACVVASLRAAPLWFGVVWCNAGTDSNSPWQNAAPGAPHKRPDRNRRNAAAHARRRSRS